MTVDTIVKDPDRIRNLDDVDDILSRIQIYEKERRCRAGVILIQRRLFGGSYEIVSDAEAEEYLCRPVLNEPRTPEWGLKFYPRSYFEDLKNKLKEKNYS